MDLKSENAVESSEELSELSYKFQRLRERLRNAVASGELTGKLPGERVLAKRYHVNAKTLSKALTDLAAEGILDRSIGRGTYVKGSAPVLSTGGRWLILCNPEEASGSTVQKLLAEHPDSEVATEIPSLRPSFLNQFKAVIDLSTSTPESLIRDMVVRNIPIVSVGKPVHSYSTHSVSFDNVWALTLACRDVLVAGHTHIAAVEHRKSTSVTQTLRSAIARYSSKATVDVFSPEDVPAMLDAGITAIICGSSFSATQVQSLLTERGAAIPRDVSLIAVGPISGEPPCTGYFIDYEAKATAAIALLNDTQVTRPTNIWLTGQHIDRGTVAPLSSAVSDSDHENAGKQYSEIEL